MKKINLQKIKKKFIWKYKEEFYIDFNYLNEQILNKGIDYNSKNKDLYQYYLDEGFEFLNPNPCFDIDYFKKQLNQKKINVEVILKKYQTFFNYFLNYGYKLKLDPHEYFQFSFISKTIRLKKNINFWAEFQKNREYFYFDTSEKFQSFFYTQTYVDIREANVHPLNHYLQYGRFENRLHTSNILFVRDDHVDFYDNPRVSTKLVKNIDLEPLKISPKISYSLESSITKNDKEINYFKIVDEEKFFAFPNKINLQVYNDNFTFSPVEILVDVLEINYLKAKCRSVSNNSYKTYPLIIKYLSTLNTENELNKKIDYISFLISYLSLRATPIFFEGNTEFFEKLKIHHKIKKIILSKSSKNQNYNFLEYYKFGHELRQIALENLTGNLFFSKKIEFNEFELSLGRIKVPSVSVLTVTNRLSNLLKHTIKQICHQKYENFEWVVVTQGELSSKDKELIKITCQNFGIKSTILEIPLGVPLGTALNMGVKNSSGEYIAKFDDDDFYLSNYLRNSINELIFTDSDMVGKWMEFTYFEGSNSIIYDRGPTKSYTNTEHITGSSLVFKRNLFYDNLTFYDISKGEDVCFRNSLVELGKKVFRIHGFDHIVFRSSKSNHHTWKISDEYLKQEMTGRNNLIEPLNIDSALKILNLDSD